MNTITLERFKFAARQIVGEYAFLENTNIVQDRVLEGMAYSLRAEIFGEHLKRAELAHPATWKDAVREALYRWLDYHWPWGAEIGRARWPVVYRVSKVDVRALYPNVSMPHARHVVHVVQEDGRGVGWIDIAKEGRALVDVLYELRRRLRSDGSWAVGRRSYYDLAKMRDWNGDYLIRIPSQLNETVLFGMKVIVDPTLPEDVIELRDNQENLVGKIFNVGTTH